MTAPEPAAAASAIPVTTGETIPGRMVEQVIGICVGVAAISVGAPSATAMMPRTLSGLPAGDVTDYDGLLFHGRLRALTNMIGHAQHLGADAVVGVRFDSRHLGVVLSEVAAFGTAVVTGADSQGSPPAPR